ncbi:MAG TPA: Crp/Fnr family transcriptional regulator [Pyrinomonadaceae bacterium]|jgi:CRP-like cAMP-binding protein|nr:Crp/Fnr family transcriptional regulator [Pyrinomonadaceae bacterium]
MFSTQAARPPTKNRILNALTLSEHERLTPYLEAVNLSAGEVLYQPEQPITHVYFPNRGTVSLVSTFEDGGSVEVGMVGNEGMFGVSIFLGSISTPLLAQVQMAGEGLRMRADVLRREFKKGGQLQDMLLRYTQAFITQIAQTAACNRAHPIEGRLAKWLLMCQDRSQSKDLGLTQEFIATMLGTRRAGVTEAAGMLQQAGVIKYRRGHITILDRERLEAKSCECYPIVRKEFARLIGSNVHALWNYSPRTATTRL